jgi:hypothetical protein
VAAAAYLDPDDLAQRVASLLKLDRHDLPPNWELIVADSNAVAAAQVYGALRQRGLSDADARAWARGPEFTLDIGQYWALSKGAGLHNYDNRYVDRLNRLPELLGQAWLGEDSAGAPVGGPVGGGWMHNQEHDVFLDRDTGEFEGW